MKTSDNKPTGGTNGIAALAILKVLLAVMEKKKLLSREEIDIILNCAEVEVDQTEFGGRITEAKFLIQNLLTDTEADDTTGIKSGATS